MVSTILRLPRCTGMAPHPRTMPLTAPETNFAHTKRVRMGEAIRFDDGVPFARQKAQVALRLRQAITELCTQPEFPQQSRESSCI